MAKRYQLNYEVWQDDNCLAIFKYSDHATKYCLVLIRDMLGGDIRVQHFNGKRLTP